MAENQLLSQNSVDKMYMRVKAALDAIGLTRTYFEKFKEQKMNDSNVFTCLGHTSLRNSLEKVVPIKEHLERFIHSFSLTSSPAEEAENDGQEQENFVNVLPEPRDVATKAEEVYTNQLYPNLDEHIGENDGLTEEVVVLRDFEEVEMLSIHSVADISDRPNQMKTGQEMEIPTNFPKDHNLPSAIPPKLLPKPSNLLKSKALKPKIEPVQIIDILQPQQRGGQAIQTDRLIFKSQELKDILSKVGKKPVALLSIAGPSRQGKSFILTFMIKYLRSLSKKKLSSDWMGKNSEMKRHKALKKGFKWRCGVERETVGIWMWPEPFTLKAKDGKEFDVLLMDTQGVFDAHTDKKDWATIVGLSLLTSSCLIFNIMNSLQEDSLITLKDFMDFGLMAKGNENDMDDTIDSTKPFQKLVFLIRDWGNEDQYPLGVKGGAKFLEWNLNQKNTENGIKLRNQIRECFQSHECFLMSEPGKYVKKENYDGSVSKMDPDFANNIQEFIEHLFDPRTFPPKTISGNILVTGEDLHQHFEQYVKIFNSDKMPTPQDMNQATALICNQAVVNKCFDKYVEYFGQIQKETLKNRAFALDHELNSSYNIARDWAFEQFQRSRKMGSQEEVQTYQAFLQEHLHKHYRVLCAENSNKRNTAVQTAIQKLQEFFVLSMNQNLKHYYQRQDDFAMEDAFNTAYKEVTMLVNKQLASNLYLENLELLSTEELQSFQNSIASWLVPLREENYKRRTRADERMKAEVKKVSSSFTQSMKKGIEQFKYWTPEQLQQLNQSLCDSKFKNFASLYSESALFPDNLRILDENLKTDFKNFEEKVDLQNKNFLLECGQQVNNLVKHYSDTIEKQQNQKGSGSFEDQRKTREECIKRLRNFVGFDRLPSSTAAGFLSELEKQISRTYDIVIEKWYPIRRKVLLQSYKDRINEFCGNGDEIIKDSELQQKHKVEKEKVLTEFKAIFSESGKKNAALSIEEKLQDFEQEIDRFFIGVHEKNLLKLEAVEQSVKGYFAKAKSLYIKKSKEINEACYDKVKFHEQSEEAKNEVRLSFENDCKVNTGLKAPKEQVQELIIFIKELPEFKTIGDGHTLDISGPILALSKELPTLEHITKKKLIKEVRWMSSRKIMLDENLCGEFWAGKNLALCAKEVTVIGNERIIDVSGGKGKSATMSKLPLPRDLGEAGLNGDDGEPGESGGNVSIVAEIIHNAHNLRITSNGGAGGDGQPGGDGADGKNGIDGDDRYEMSMKKLKKLFPSPAKFLKSNRTENLEIGEESLRVLMANSGELREKDVCNKYSRYWELETTEGAIFRYSFFEGVLQGTVGSRSFYVWFQGAPGICGQPGGLGGLGGRGGRPGNPGDVYIPPSYKGEIQITAEKGIHGITGQTGKAGKDGIDGIPGTDYAYLDPYAGILSPTSNRYEIKEFRGNLAIQLGRKDTSGVWRPFREVAYCPLEQRNITFEQSQVPREGQQLYKDPEAPKDRAPPTIAARKPPIDLDDLKAVTQRLW